jgi:hypothetical protein
MSQDRSPLDLETGEIVLGLIGAVSLLGLIVWLAH